MKKSFFALIFILLIIILLLVNKFFLTSKTPNIIFISIDTLRQDHVGAYGYKRDVTPVIDKVASEGVRFKNSYSSAPWTLPSHMSMFTGLPPSVHKIDFDIKVLDKSIKTFPELLKEKGYSTGGFISAVYLKHIYGYDRGFDVYKAMYGNGAEKLTDAGINWIKDRSDAPFFLFLHYFDAHWPYMPPVKYAEKMGIDTTEKKWQRYGRLAFLRNFSDPVIKMPDVIREKIINLYDSEILRIDTNIGRLIEFLKNKKLYDNTIIVITSDHGEEFKEHGSFGHFHQLYSELINVPLIIRFPEKFPAGKVPEVPVSSVDISGTLLSLADIDVPDQFKRFGRNLLEMTLDCNDNKNIFKRKLISETRKGSSHHFALISDNFKYITPYRFRPIIKEKKWVNVNQGLYNTKEDSADLQNLISSKLSNELRSAVLAPFGKKISEYIKNNIDCVRIIFFPPEKGNVVMTGNISYKNVPELTPFGVNFEDTDMISDGVDGNSTEFRVVFSREKKEIVIHLSKTLSENKKFELKVYHEGEMVVDKSIDISKLFKAEVLFKGLTGSVYIMKRGTLNKSIKPGLTQHEKSLLKSLGYIN